MFESKHYKHLIHCAQFIAEKGYPLTAIELYEIASIVKRSLPIVPKSKCSICGALTDADTDPCAQCAQLKTFIKEHPQVVETIMRKIAEDTTQPIIKEEKR
jgi:hypothetical protein